MPAHNIEPEDIGVTKVMSSHVDRSVKWHFVVGNTEKHDLFIQGQVDSGQAVADVSVVDLEAKIARQHLRELDLSGYDDLDMAQGARNALAAALNARLDIHRIPGINQLPLW